MKSQSMELTNFWSIYMRNLKPVAVMWGRRRFATARAAVRAPTFGHHSIPHVWTSHEKQYRHRMGIKWIDDYRAHTHAMGNWYIKNTHIARRLIKKEIDFIHFNRLHIMKPLLFFVSLFTHPPRSLHRVIGVSNIVRESHMHSECPRHNGGVCIHTIRLNDTKNEFLSEKCCIFLVCRCITSRRCMKKLFDGTEMLINFIIEFFFPTFDFDVIAIFVWIWWNPPCKKIKNNFTFVDSKHAMKLWTDKDVRFCLKIDEWNWWWFRCFDWYFVAILDYLKSDFMNWNVFSSLRNFLHRPWSNYSELKNMN